MKKLLLCLFLVIGLFAEEGTEHWTKEDIEFYDNGGPTIDYGLTVCTYGSSDYGYKICQALTNAKELNLYIEVDNKPKIKQSFKQMCYWMMKMSQGELMEFINFRDENGSPILVPSEIKPHLKSCAKLK